ncbi:unnamed protein product [Camellia sinensis]
MAATSGPLSKNPSGAASFNRTLSRRVYFSDEPPPKPQTNPKQWDSNNDTNQAAEEEEKEGRACGLCCAWTSLIAGCIVLVLLLSGGLFLYFLQSGLPEFRVKRLDFTKIEIVSNNQRTHLSMDFQILINATNKNEKHGLSYGPLKVKVSADEVNLGSLELSAFKQKPRQVTQLKLLKAVRKLEVNAEDGQALKSDYKSRELVVNLVFKGSISMNLGGQVYNGLPLTVLCDDIAQSDIDNGLQPECRVKILNIADFGKLVMTVLARHEHCIALWSGGSILHYFPKRA